MGHAAEIFRRVFHRTPDVRQIQINSSARELQEKFAEAVEPALGHATFELNREQSDQILPSAEGAPPLFVHVILMGEEYYSTSLERENTQTFFTLDGRSASLSSLVPVEKPTWYERYRLTPLKRKDADGKDVTLQALEFGHRLADTLIQAKAANPGIFRYI